ncbi:MAG: ferredoxin [Elusimicrobiales bacterium]|nr:ferredoxin [Elusimicrobiales bacterium]
MKAIVNQDNCIGCGLCAGDCPEVFELNGDKAQGKEIPAGKEDAAKNTAANCPVQAIEIVEVVK